MVVESLEVLRAVHFEILVTGVFAVDVMKRNPVDTGLVNLGRVGRSSLSIVAEPMQLIENLSVCCLHKC